MKLTVNPNRMELFRLKRRLVVAKRGHKLLKDKQDGLMRKFLEVVERVKAEREEVEKGLALVYRNQLLAQMAISCKEVETALSWPKKKLQVQVSTINVMNVETPLFAPSIEGEGFGYSLADTSGDLDISVLSLEKIINEMIALAQDEKTVELLAIEIERTRRRVNALEYTLIPNIEETIRSITMKLSEAERSNLTRLMKVKEMVKGREGSL
ncbi:MAG: V-type ATP synthase subunit D [Thermodesulfobacteriota bacterium]